MDWMIVHLPIAGTDVYVWQLVLIGLCVGVIGGFFGVGGAFMVTPALNVFGFPMAYAIGTDMAHMAGKSIVATMKHRKLGNVDMKLGLLMVVFTAVGIEIGAEMIVWLERIGRCGPVVRIVYMFLLFGLGTYMLYEYFMLRRREKNGEKVHDAGVSRLAKRLQGIHLWPMVNLKVSGTRISLWVIGGVALVTGFAAGFLGVGGGFVRMPSLIYLIGCPTVIAVGTDLFEVMISGAYGAFTYALKGKVEIMAAVIMLLGAAVGAQFGTLATKYVKGIVIRCFFAIIMILAGVSVVFKHVSSEYRYSYEDVLQQQIVSELNQGGQAKIDEWIGKDKVVKIRQWAVDHGVVFADVARLRGSVDERQWPALREWIVSHNVNFKEEDVDLALVREWMAAHNVAFSGKDVDLVGMRDWIGKDKGRFKTWMESQAPEHQTAPKLEKLWNELAGWLMLGSACALSLIIIVKMFQGIAYERRLNAAKT